MLRLWRERALIALSPDSLALARIEGSFRPRLATGLVRECDAQIGTEPWQGAIAALGAAASDLAGVSCDVTIILSNHFVRYTLVPASERLNGETENLAFARYCFAKVHGERSKAWEIRLSGTEARSARVASAIDAALLQGLRACFLAGGKARLVSVQPYLMAAFNRCARRARTGSTWLLLLERRRACLACIDHGHWAALRNIKGEFDDPARWAELLDRERHLAATPDPPTDVLVHAAQHHEPARAGPWRFEPLSKPSLAGFSPLENSRLAMALCSE